MKRNPNDPNMANQVGSGSTPHDYGRKIMKAEIQETAYYGISNKRRRIVRRTDVCRLHGGPFAWTMRLLAVLVHK